MTIRAIVRCVVASFLVVVGSLEAAGSPPARAAFRESPPPQTMRVIVEFKGSPSVTALDAGVASHDALFEQFRHDLIGPSAQRKASSERQPIILHEYRTAILGASVEIHPAAIERLRRLPYVERVSPDVRVTLSPVTAGDSEETVDARSRVNAAGLGVGGAGIVVAVIDTGIDYMHPALGGGFGPGFKVIGGYDFVNQDDDPVDDQGHGTHVAGTIAADAPTLLGVAPDAALLAYKVLSAEGSGDGSDIIAAIERALDPNQDGNPDDRADVINLSLGGPGDAEDPLSRAVDSAFAAGAIVVVAAGNDGLVSSIGSPGTAVDAITVAAVDDEHKVTGFSSRGPSPRLLGFKPDIAAPGDQIASTRIGGGVLTISGTSMAAPHVAGVAALLRQLHPDWDAAAVKSAIISGAVAVDDHPFARGAGRVDAAASHEASLFRDQSGLSFGIRHAVSGSTDTARTVRFSNRSAQQRSVSIEAGSVPAGVAFTIQPSSLMIPAGGTGEVTVTLKTSNDLLEFPESLIVAGDLRVSGSVSGTIPWGFLRTTRATVTYDGIVSSIQAVGRDGGQTASTRSAQSFEFFLPPGRMWDFIITGYDLPADEGEMVEIRRTIVRENVEITSDHLIDVSASEAMLEVTLDPRDHRNQPLLSRSHGNEPSLHVVGLYLFRQQEGMVYSNSVVAPKSYIARTFYSPLSERYSLHHFEHVFDHDTYEWYAIEHELINGLEGSKTLTGGGSDLMHAKVHWSRPPLQKNRLNVCTYDSLTTQITIKWTGCWPAEPAERTSLDLYINEERSSLSHSGLVVGSGAVTSQAFRGRGGKIVVSSDTKPGPAAPTIRDGGEYRLAAGPMFPFEIPGTTSSFWAAFPGSGFYGSSGETIAEGRGTLWRILDATGKVVDSGAWRNRSGSPAPPAPQPGTRFIAEREDLEGFGWFSRGTLDVKFGNDGADVTAPNLTSLRAVNASGAVKSTFDKGEVATLHFSIADIDFRKAVETKPSRPESTRAWARPQGAGEWVPLSVFVIGSESGSLGSLRRLPAGDIYMADLSPITAFDRSWIDVRLEFEDVAGNRVSWTHEMALAVGDPSLPRKRSVFR